MNNLWTEIETTTHQDHVIAHVIGATVFGTLIWDETCYLLLDIGFVWNVYLDGEMGLVPYPVMSNELEVDETFRHELKADIDSLMNPGKAHSFLRMTPVSLKTPLVAVTLQRNMDSLRAVLFCDSGRLIVETSIATREVTVMEIDDSSVDLELSKVARDERDFVRKQLADELGREPTTAEIDEWLREHTESY